MDISNDLQKMTGTRDRHHVFEMIILITCVFAAENFLEITAISKYKSYLYILLPIILFLLSFKKIKNASYYFKECSICYFALIIVSIIHSVLYINQSLYMSIYASMSVLMIVIYFPLNALTKQLTMKNVEDAIIGLSFVAELLIILQRIFYQNISFIGAVKYRNGIRVQADVFLISVAFVFIAYRVVERATMINVFMAILNLSCMLFLVKSRSALLVLTLQKSYTKNL